VVRDSSWSFGDWKLRSSVKVLRVPLPSLWGKSVLIALLLSTKKTGERGNSEINAVSDRLGEVAVGAKLLPEADEDEGLNEPVYVASHRLALLGRENPVCEVPPVLQLSAGRVAPPCANQRAAMNAWLTPLMFIVKQPCSMAE
jgi:hypothetical protein